MILIAWFISSSVHNLCDPTVRYRDGNLTGISRTGFIRETMNNLYQVSTIRKLIDEHLSLQWCREHVVLPLINSNNIIAIISIIFLLLSSTYNI